MSSRCVRLKMVQPKRVLAIVADSAGQIQPLKGILNSAMMRVVIDK